jgi:hypothetical protein
MKKVNEKKKKEMLPGKYWADSFFFFFFLNSFICELMNLVHRLNVDIRFFQDMEVSSFILWVIADAF